MAGLGILTLLSFRYPSRARAAAASRRLPQPGPAPAPASTPAAVVVLPPTPVPQLPAPAPGGIEALITREAQAQGVDPRVALMFADLESGLNPNVTHDKDWPFRNRCEGYRKHVLDNPRFADNPARTDPSAWIGYGLFGLLSPYFAGPHEHPRALLDPATNARRGIAFLKRKLEQAGGDIRTARLRYAGCYPPERCSPGRIATLDRRLQAGLQRWGLR